MKLREKAAEAERRTKQNSTKQQIRKEKKAQNNKTAQPGDSMAMLEPGDADAAATGEDEDPTWRCNCYGERMRMKLREKAAEAERRTKKC